MIQFQLSLLPLWRWTNTSTKFLSLSIWGLLEVCSVRFPSSIKKDRIIDLITSDISSYIPMSYLRTKRFKCLFYCYIKFTSIRWRIWRWKRRTSFLSFSFIRWEFAIWSQQGRLSCTIKKSDSIFLVSYFFLGSLLSFCLFVSFSSSWVSTITKSRLEVWYRGDEAWE